MRLIAAVLILVSSAVFASEVDYANKQIKMRVAYAATSNDRALANLDYIHHKTAGDPSKQLEPRATGDSYWLLPLTLGEIRGFTTKYDLFTLPKKPETRRSLLKGIDAVIFVADGEPARVKANAAALKALQEDLSAAGIDWKLIPFVVQYEKKGGDASPAAHHAALGLTDQKELVADAAAGTGVFDTLKAAAKLSLMALRDEANGKTQPNVGTRQGK